MFEESESERYRDKLKNEYQEFVHNHDVYQTLTKFNKETYGNIIETAILAFHCSAEDLDMDQLKAIEEFLKIAKTKYHALVATQDDEGGEIEISDDEDPEPVKHPEVQKFEEIKYHLPRKIPAVTNNINIELPPIQQWNHVYPHQNVMPPPPWNPWRDHAPNFGINSVYNVPQHPSQMQPVLIPPPPVPQFDAITRPGSSFMFNKSMCPVPQPVQFPQYQQIRPNTSRQPVPEKPEAKSYREYRFMKLQEEKQKKKHEELVLKKKEHDRLERERNEQKELPQNQNGKKLSNYTIRKKQVEDYNKRESDGQASTSSKQCEPIKSALKTVGTAKENKKTVRWNDNANECLTYDREHNISINNSHEKSASSKSVNELPSTLKAHISSEKVKSSTENSKPPKKAAISDKSKEKDQKGPKKAAIDKPGSSKEKVNEKAAVPIKSKKNTKESSKTEKPAKLVAKKSDQKKAAPKNGSKTEKLVPKSTPESSKDKKTEKQNSSNKDDRKIIKLKVIKAKPIKLLKDTDCLFKRKSDSPEKDLNKPKRLKESTNEDKSESGTSSSDFQIKEAISIVNTVIKEEQMSEDENLDGKTDVSSNNDNIIEPENVQRMESDHIRIKQEEDLNMNDTASTVEQIDIKEEVMSTIDQENSSVHSDKLDVNAITENFINVCDNPDFLNSIEKLIDFSEYEDLTEDAVNNNNNSEVIQIDSQEKCASWLEHINNSDFDRTTESPNNDVQFYSTKDEEAEPDDEIVPYFPVRQLGAPEIIPKEEEQ